MDAFFNILKAILFGVIEGVTEWLPVSSTGHMILLEHFLPLTLGNEIFADAFYSMFEVVIQLGAILAVILLFFRKLNPFARSKTELEKRSTWRLWLMVLIGILPSGIIGVVLDNFLDAKLGNYVVVSLMLIVYGVAFILVERRKNAVIRLDNVETISWRMALAVGAFQVLSLIPGTSRSGATILGAMLLGLSRGAASEFSFFMAIPTMAGASMIRGLKFVKFALEYDGDAPWLLACAVLAVAFAVAFAVSLAAIRFLMDFVRRHTFTSFGIYRIALGAVVLGYFLIAGR